MRLLRPVLRKRAAESTNCKHSGPRHPHRTPYTYTLEEPRRRTAAALRLRLQLPPLRVGTRSRSYALAHPPAACPCSGPRSWRAAEGNENRDRERNSEGRRSVRRSARRARVGRGKAHATEPHPPRNDARTRRGYATVQPNTRDTHTSGRSLSGSYTCQRDASNHRAIGARKPWAAILDSSALWSWGQPPASPFQSSPPVPMLPRDPERDPTTSALPHATVK